MGKVSEKIDFVLEVSRAGAALCRRMQAGPARVFARDLLLPVWGLAAGLNLLAGKIRKSIASPKSCRYGLTCAAIVKNEGPYIREWIAYHKTAGADHVILYDNDSDDGLRDLIDDFVQSGFVEYRSLPGRGMQLKAYNDCIRRMRKESKYIAFIDIDEFLVPLAGGNLYEVVDAILTADRNSGGLAVNWRMFGSSGYDAGPEGLVTERYLYRAEDFGRGNGCVKTIANPRLVRCFRHVHYPSYYPGIYNIDENGRPVFGPYHMDQITEKIQINHYFTKSREEWIRRRSLGKADTHDERDKRTLKEFEAYDNNDVYDGRMLAYRDRIRCLSDKELPVLYERKEECCGCSACASVCPTESIRMEADEEGFLYPSVNTGTCIRCRRCLKICAFKSDLGKEA